jgi:hypothetical protein
MSKLATLATTQFDPVLAINFHHTFGIVDHELAELVRVAETILVTDTRV